MNRLFCPQIFRATYISAAHQTRQSFSPVALRIQTQARGFRSTVPIMVKAGDAIPSVELMEGAPDKKVNLAEELKSGKGLIIGVPAAFSPGCSETHVPGYIESEKTKNFGGPVFVVAVNDAFVMKAWGKNLDPNGKSGLRFIADPTGAFVKALDVTFDATALLGNERSKRFAILTKDGKIEKAEVEPDNVGIDVSSVDKVL